MTQTTGIIEKSAWLHAFQSIFISHKILEKCILQAALESVESNMRNPNICTLQCVPCVSSVIQHSNSTCVGTGPNVLTFQKCPLLVLTEKSNNTHKCDLWDNTAVQDLTCWSSILPCSAHVVNNCIVTVTLASSFQVSSLPFLLSVSCSSI